MLARFVSNVIVALGVAVIAPMALAAQASGAVPAAARPTWSRWTVGDSTWSKFAGDFGAGLEYGFGRVGVRVEGRDFVYKFDRYGFDKTQHGIAWQGGVTLTF